MGHHDFNTLLVNIFSAADVVNLLDVRELVGETLSVQIFFSFSSLVRHNFVGYHNVGEAGLLALRHEDVILFVANIQALVVVRFNHAFSALLDMFKLFFPIKDVLHLNNYTKQIKN